MPDTIHLLSDKIANRIAAGEVVQRPASVVKELLENALDAGASTIRLHLRQAGKTMIQVIDDGVGMTETDARMCFERHATSKLRSVEDLEAIRTMGFRGEALASIASVSRVELKTKKKERDMGTKLIIEGSDIKTLEPCATLDGTSMTVQNLFFNTPARRKFLKSDPVELKHIHEEFLRVALAYPDIFFSLVHNDNETYHLPKSNLKTRIINVLGKSSEDKLFKLEETTDVVKISGFVGSPASAKKRRGQQYFFVNNRFIKSPYLHHAIKGAYEGLIQSDQHPMYFIFMEMDPERVDVNVHPTKQEVKFEDGRILYNYLKVTTRHALAGANALPAIDFDRRGTAGFDDFQGAVRHKPEMTQREKNNLDQWQKLYNVSDEDPLQSPGAVTPSGGQDLFDKEEKILSIKDRVLIVPTQEGAYFIDRQAAETLLLYLQFSDDQPVASQKEIFPTTIHLSASDAELMPEIMPVINALGFEIEEFGDNSFLNYAVPAIENSDIHIEELLEDLLDDYRNNRPSSKSRKAYLAKSLAERISRKRKKSLNEAQMRALFHRLIKEKQSLPEGIDRKTMTHLSVTELLKLIQG